MKSLETFSPAFIFRRRHELARTFGFGLRAINLSHSLVKHFLYSYSSAAHFLLVSKEFAGLK